MGRSAVNNVFKLVTKTGITEIDADYVVAVTYLSGLKDEAEIHMVSGTIFTTTDIKNTLNWLSDRRARI